MFVGFNVRVECENLVKNCEESKVTGSKVDNSQKAT